MKYIDIWREHAELREGKRLKVYKDSLGKLTVGIGHLITRRDKLSLGDSITEERLEKFFLEDTSRAEFAALAQAEETGIDTDEWIAALISVNFQLGTEWNKEFKHTWKAILQKDYNTAIKNLRASKWYKQTPVRVEDFIKAIEDLKKPFHDRPLSKTRTVRGGVVSGLGVAAMSATDIITETQDQIEPLIKYADTLKILFVIVALIGIGLTIYARIDDRRKGLR